MKEKFREWNFKTNIKVKYKLWITETKFEIHEWAGNQKELIDAILDIINYYEEQDIKLTNRQLYYQLVGKSLIPNAMEIYKKICTILTDARYSGLIDWDSIIDKGRVPTKPLEFNNIKERVELAIYNYRLPRWKDQENYVELYCEKEAGETVLSPIAHKYHIYFGANKGYSGAAAMYELSQRLKEQLQKGKRITLLYFGDHDPSGLDMVRDIRERTIEFLQDIRNIANRFQIVPLALNMEQIRQYQCPPNPAKISDPRAKWYIERHGNKSWELDAIDPKELQNIADKGVRDFLDIKKYNDWIKQEEKEKKILINFVNTLK